MLELLREVKVEEFVENFKNKELCEILEATIEFNNYRNYYNIDKMGIVKIIPAESIGSHFSHFFRCVFFGQQLHFDMLKTTGVF